MGLLSVVPRWLLILIVVAFVVWIANALGFVHIHFNVGGSLGF